MLDVIPRARAATRPHSPSVPVRTLVFALLVGCGGLAAQPAPVVSPADRSKLEGSTTTSYPLGRFDCRYQQVFDDLGPSRLLAGHSYRRDGLSTRGDIAPFQTSMTIQMAPAAAKADAADRTFAKNLGAAPTVVLPQSWLSFPLTRKPTTVPGAFVFAVPYKTPYAWQGQGSLCLDITIDSNQLATGTDKTFSASIDGQELFTSGRNLQPGYPFGQGCPAPGQTRNARATFEVRHLGGTIDLNIQARDGVPTSGTDIAQSILLLSMDATAFPWPPGSACKVYGSATVVLPLTTANTAGGDWSGTIPVGLAPSPGFEMTSQVFSMSGSGAMALSDASRLITPPAGVGVVSSRIVSASDRTSATGSVSFSVPVTRFQ